MFYKIYYTFFDNDWLLHEYIRDTFALSEIRIKFVASLYELLYTRKQAKAMLQDTWQFVK